MVHKVNRSVSGIRKRTMLAAVSLLALSGCELGPNFSRPNPPAPATFEADVPAHGVPSEATSGIPDPNWWNSFGDPELTSLESKVVSQNLDVQIATARVDEAASQVNQARAALFPMLDFSGKYTREKPFSKSELEAVGTSNLPPDISQFAGGFTNPVNMFDYGFSAMFDLDLWGKNRRLVEAAAAQRTASAEARRAALLNAEALMASDYIQLRGVQQIIAITQKNLASANHLVRLTEDRERAGLTTSLDVATARATAATISGELPTLINERDDLVSNIEILIGALPGALQSELSAPKAVPPVPPAIPVGMPADLLRRRPDIREAEAKLHATTAQVGVAVASFFPDISLTGSVNLESFQLSNLNQLNALTYAFGPALSLPIFHGGQLNATLSLRKADQKEAAVTYAKTVVTAFHQVNDALTAYEQEQAKNAALAIAVAQNQKALSLAEDQYSQGLADYLQVINAQQALLQTQQSKAQSDEQVSADLVTVYQALGGGWEQTYPAPQAAK